MDLILTGRAVQAPEALGMGLANRVVPPGQALAASLALAQQLATLPQVCLRSDRMSALEQWGLSGGGRRRRRGAPRPRRHQQWRDARRSGSVCRRSRPRWRCARLTPRRGTSPVRRGRPTVAAFDFDGTLTDAGSVFPFLVSLRGPWPVLRAVAALSPGLLPRPSQEAPWPTR